jgi:hypothetical protein
MSQFLGSVQPHKLWVLAIIFITWGLLFATFRFRVLTLERLRPWGWLLGVACIGLFIVLMAIDDPRADYLSAFMLSFFVAVEWIGWSERRSAKQPTS